MYGRSEGTRSLCFKILEFVACNLFLNVQSVMAASEVAGVASVPNSPESSSNLCASRSEDGLQDGLR